MEGRYIHRIRQGHLLKHSNPIFHNIISFCTKKGFGEKNYSPSTERATGGRSEISTPMLRYSTTGRHL